MKNLYFVFLLYFILHSDTNAQQGSLWLPISSQQRIAKGIRYITPTHYATFYFDIKAFRDFYGHGNLRNSLFSVPLPSGEFLTFTIIETPIFEEELSKKYPGFNSYTGINEFGDRLKMSISPFGIHAMVFSDQHGQIFIDPLTLQDHNDVYQVYYKKDIQKRKGSFRCNITQSVDHIKEDILGSQKESFDKLTNAGDCQLRSYRLAIACTGEYAAFHGGTIEKVLAAYNNTMTRVNGVYEKDLGITMKLIANTDKIIYLDPNTDPFTNNDVEKMLSENQATIDAVIGRNNYDIGHVFSTGSGGIAQLRSTCSSSKAMGVTGLNQPVGDPFDIDYVAHEMGHQFGADHTQNNDCQRGVKSSMEPGSASTIMGYAGICDPNVQNNSDAYFHAYSIFEITNFVVAGIGNTCANIIPEYNAKPILSVAKNQYTIPKTTAFVLTANASDSDGDSLTYCWEQMDNEVATMPPLTTSNKGPMFRSIAPSSSPSRYFPDLLKKYGNWEVLPSVNRDLKFRCTVRDNHPRFGCTDEVNVVVKVSAQAGPFVVSYPNTSSVSWLTGTTQMVTWDVANTDSQPINCANVSLYLSTDGGLTYPILLVENVPNNGATEITVPGVPTTKARVMVKAVDNIFFDVSNANFKIVSSFELKFDHSTITVCDENDVHNNMEIKDILNLSTPISLSINKPLSPLTYEFTQNPIDQFPANVGLSISGWQALPKGRQQVEVLAMRNPENLLSTFSVFVGYTGSSTVSMIYPEKYADNVTPNNVNFVWHNIAGVKEYTFELSFSPLFDDFIHSATISDTTLSVSLLSDKVYYWRVKPISPCMTLPYSGTASFRTSGGNTGTAFMLNNEALLVDKDSTGIIDTTLLKVLGENFDLITFTILKEPEEGVLYRNDISLSLGSTFTMRDVLDGYIKYQHNGGSIDHDFFNFGVIDDQNRWLPDQTFVIKIKQGNLGLVVYRERLIRCFGEKSGILRCEGYGGVLPYLYSIDGIHFQQEAVFADLEADTYTIYIKDGTGEVVSSIPIELRDPEPLDVVLSLEMYDVVVNASGGTGTLSYSMDGINFQSEPIFRNNENGYKLIFVQDEMGCQSLSEIVLNVPHLKVSGEIVTDVSCATQSAMITLRGEGGFQPYTYSVDGMSFASLSMFTVPPGQYVFWIKDAGGRVALSDKVTTNQPKPIEVQLLQNKFEITVLAQGGTGKLQYSTNNVQYNDNNVLIFAANGVYKIYVRDSLLCNSVTNLTLNVLTNVNIVSRDISCHDQKDGYIKLTPTDGVQPYKYSLNGSDFSNKREWSGLDGGEYRYIVKDSKNDSLVGAINIKNPDTISLGFLVTNNEMAIVVNGGTPPYNYSIDNGLTFYGNNVFTNLENRQYSIIVKDKNGCTATGLILISQVEDFPIKGIKMYPNPTKGTVYLVVENGDLVIQNIQLFDLSGKSMEFEYNTIHEATQIWIDRLWAGIYILQLVTNQGKINKLIVKRDKN